LLKVIRYYRQRGLTRAVLELAGTDAEIDAATASQVIVYGGIRVITQQALSGRRGEHGAAVTMRHESTGRRER
jgi:hypothetical protein